MFCPNCGSSNPDGSIFCGSCGQKMPVVAPINPNAKMQKPAQPVQPNQPQQPSQRSVQKPPVKKKKTSILLFIIPLLLLLFFIVAVFAGIIIWKVLNPSALVKVELPTEEATVYAPAYEEVETVVLTPHSTYEVIKSNDTWTQANSEALSYGGELVSINSADEFRKVCQLADDKGIKVFWAGARRYSYSWDNEDWLDGSPMDYTHWLKGEPSYTSEEGYDETYLMVFKVGNEWYFNDAENDVSQYYKNKMGYIVEYVKYY